MPLTEGIKNEAMHTLYDVKSSMLLFSPKLVLNVSYLPNRLGQLKCIICYFMAVGMRYGQAFWIFAFPDKRT